MVKRGVHKRSVQSYKELPFFSIFSHLRPFPQVFGQVKESLILELRKVTRVPHAVACPMDFDLLCDLRKMTIFRYF